MSEPLQPTRQIAGSEQNDSKRENREIPPASEPHGPERSVNASGGTMDVDAGGKSDGSVVPAKSANKDAAEASAESMEERDPAKRNAE